MKRTLLLVSLLLAFAAYSGWVKWKIASRGEQQTSLRAGAVAPDFTLRTLDGQDVHLAEVAAAHELVVVNFWATWCGPCRIEMPQLEKSYEDLQKRGVEILAVNAGEDVGTVREYLASRTFHFPVLLDGRQAVVEAWDVQAFPTTVLVDRQGKIVAIHEGLHEYVRYWIDEHLPRRPGEGA